MKQSLLLLSLLAMPCVISSCKDDAENQNAPVTPAAPVTPTAATSPLTDKIAQQFDKSIPSDSMRAAFHAGYNGDTSNLEALSGGDMSYYCTGAAVAGRTDLVLKCIERKKGASPNAALKGAAAAGHQKLVQMMLDKGASPDAGLWGAAFGGHMALAQSMLERGAKDLSDGLISAACSGHCDIVQLMLDNGADPNRGLHFAAEMGHTDVVKLLLAHPGINVNATIRQDKTPLDWAEENGHTECAELIRAAGGKRAADF